jgi:transposase
MELAMDNKLYISIDVSKEWIDVAIHGSRSVHRLANTEAAMTEWIGQLDHSRVGLVCFEPTGGDERVLRRCLSQAKLPYVRVHPNEGVAFRRPRGITAMPDTCATRRGLGTVDVLASSLDHHNPTGSRDTA